MRTGEVARDGYQLIRAEGVLDGVSEESSALAQILKRPAAEITAHYILDMSEIEYMNSAMLGLLVRFLSACQESGKRFVLMAPPPSIRTLIEMIGLTRFMTVAADEQEAMRKIGVNDPAKLASDIDYQRLADCLEHMLNASPLTSAPQHKDDLRKIIGA